MRVLATLYVAALVVGVRPDSRWKLITRTRDISMYVDSARIDSNRADGMIGVWLRFDYTKPEPVPGDDKRVFSQSQVELGIDCHAQMVRNLSIQLFAPDGKPTGPVSHEFPPKPVSFAEHPFGHGTFVGVCAWLRAPDRWRPVVIDTSVVPH